MSGATVPRLWFGTRRSRGASAPEYAIGAAVLAVALLAALQGLEDAADERYDDQQAIVGTPVTDLSGGATTTSLAGTTTTVTLPPLLTTTTTAPVETTTTSTSTSLPTSVFSATGSGVVQNSNFWRARVAVSVSPTRTGSVSGTYREDGTGPAQPWSCTLSSGACTYETGNISRSAVSTVVFTVTTAPASAVPNNLPTSATASRP
jgi:Flp pilus assembly pilin Flp